MKTDIRYPLQPETLALTSKLPPGTVETESAVIGLMAAEPVIIMADALLRYVRAYNLRFGEAIGADFVAEAHVRTMLEALGVLLDLDGAVAWELGRSTDSKSNGMMFALIELICAEAGINYNDLK